MKPIEVNEDFEAKDGFKITVVGIKIIEVLDTHMTRIEIKYDGGISIISLNEFINLVK